MDHRHESWAREDFRPVSVNHLGELCLSFDGDSEFEGVDRAVRNVVDRGTPIASQRISLLIQDRGLGRS